ncbi:putative di- and tripeptidase DUG2 [Candida viswanathii]|uniref:Putative di-and tripeptidase DUG2 n=1 Tax=Candida viswanathii TaxID=5486 RepID=A0A367XSN3_9ASCO|nr:putative di- and tripeptidase DUG2 [Candida viswanathii]
MIPPHNNIHESEYASHDRKPLPISSIPSTENLISTPRGHTPIRLNSPHLSMAELSLHNHRHHQASTASSSSSSELHGEQRTEGRSSSAMPHFSNFSPEIVAAVEINRSSTPCSLEMSSSTDGMIIINGNGNGHVNGTTTSSITKSPSTVAHDETHVPQLVHKWTHTHSILCCVALAENKLLYCGTQDGKVLVYNMDTYSLSKIIPCGSSTEQPISILANSLNENEDFLFVAGSDSLIKVYDLKTPECVCTHVVYSLVDIGDIFSILWCEITSTIYIGAQNASILWCHVSLDEKKLIEKHHHDLEKLPHFRYDKFFDSKGPGGSQNTLQTQHNLLRRSSTKKTRVKLFECRSEDIVRFAHNGYVYCLEVVHNTSIGNSNDKDFLLSGGGDGLVNIWTFGDNTLKKLTSLENDESVLSMKIQGSLLYVGLGDCSINVWDLMTLQMIRSFRFSGNYDEVLSLDVYNNCIFKACSSSGLVKFSTMAHSSNVCDGIIMMSVPDEDGIINAVRTFSIDSKTYLLAGGTKSLSLWDISEPNELKEQVTSPTASSNNSVAKRLTNDDLLCMLKKYVSFKTISKNPQLYLEESRHCAQFLSKLLNKFGAYQTKLLPVENGNPIVVSEFKANSSTDKSKKTRLLWYAHYDVVDATKNEAIDWSTDPFVLTAKEGNLYARGVSDNKGPTLAAIYAVAELYDKQELNCDVVFVIEGEEECGSVGFQQVISDNRGLIGEIDWIMLSNSYWLDDVTPCLNYGLRGVINASVTIKSDKPDRHSGVDGGVSGEPTMDMMHILSKLMDPVTKKIQLPGFYDNVLPLDKDSEKLYDKIAEYLGIQAKTLMVKWKEPSLTIHKIQVSGPNNNTVIPQLVSATISMRIVPNQDLEVIKKSLIETLTANFTDLNSDNHLLIEIFHEAEPWLGDYQNQVYSVLYNNIVKHWGQEPLFIREGGTIPSIRFLEKCFNAQAAQIPCGQSSDNAHLKDEKLRVLNLYKLRSILTDSFKELGHT